MDLVSEEIDLKKFLETHANTDGSFSVSPLYDNMSPLLKLMKSRSNKHVDDFLSGLKGAEDRANLHCRAQELLTNRIQISKFKVEYFGNLQQITLVLKVHCIPDNWIARIAYVETLNLVGSMLTGRGSEYISDRSDKISEFLSEVQREVDDAKSKVDPALQ